MDSTTMPSVDWGDQTVVERSKLSNHLFEFDNDEDFNLKIKNYEIEIDPHGVRKRSEFIKYVKDEMPKFIYSKERRQEIRDNGGWPYDKARRTIGDISTKSDGFYSEVLLYLIMEGFFDFPLVSHKMSYKEDYNTQVKGSDGLYIGTYDGQDVVGYGEAKFYQNKSNALTDAVEGVSDYHGIEGIDEREAELDIAREHISRDLEKEEIERILQDILHMDRQLPIIHPILVAYENKNYEEIKEKATSRDESLEIIEKFHNREEFTKLVNKRIAGADDLKKIQKLIFFLRVEDTQEFKDDLEEII